MSDPVRIAIIASIGPTLIGLVTVILQYLQGRKIEVVHRATNSLTERLVQTTKTDAHAAGVLEGRAAEKSDSAVAIHRPPDDAKL